jgi:O-acetyl-ADP-ribose deacetylase (regulator of RNase III)
MKKIYEGKLKNLGFVLAQGDLFDAEVEAVVNSEQTDFILSRDDRSISGQIRKRFGQSIQDDLDEQTERQVLPPGTVLATQGGGHLTHIYHAGFHDPEVRYDSDQEAETANHLSAIGSCLHAVLHQAVRQNTRSVAFPFIGCGLFGLPESMLIKQYFYLLEQFAEQHSDCKLEVWLVIRDGATLDVVVGELLRMFMESRQVRPSIRIAPTGYSILDDFSQRVHRATDEVWVSWLICRYCEVALEIMLAGLAHSLGDEFGPDRLFANKAPCFGDFLEKGIALAKSSSDIDVACPLPALFARILNSKAARKNLGSINQARNAIAHGRNASPPIELHAQMMEGLLHSEWVSATKAGESVLSWSPWIESSAEFPGKHGLFGGFRCGLSAYLIPDTGDTFELSSVSPANNFA